MPEFHANRAWLTSLVVMTGALLAGALFNGFPLIFPDSGTYLAVAFGPEYAIDRSSFYGLILKPVVGLISGTGGLWLAVIVQAACVSALLLKVMESLAPGRNGMWLLLMVPLTALPWHVGQLMPDAFSGALIILVFMAMQRRPVDPVALLLWLLAILVALTHYTHLVLLGTTAMAMALTQLAMGASWRETLLRAATPVTAVALALGIMISANSTTLGRASVSPMGPLFLFARLNEDGLIPSWLDRHCGRDAPTRLCSVRAQLPHDSQALLWGNGDGVIGQHIWYARPQERWAWINMLGDVNRKAIAEQPLAFALASARGALDQFVHFQVGDDECPDNCRGTAAGVGYTLARYRPGAVDAFHASRQGTSGMPVPLLCGITTPIAMLALLTLPFLTIAAYRRSDEAITLMCVATASALVVNAILAGALSDVHDRYQSRLIWLVPLVVMLAWLRWKAPAQKPS